MFISALNQSAKVGCSGIEDTVCRIEEISRTEGESTY